MLLLLLYVFLGTIPPHTCHSSIRDRGASPEHLPPPSVPDEAPGSLLDDLDTEGAGGVALVTVALHRGVPLLLEGPVHSAPVLEPVLGEFVFGPDSCGLLLVFSGGTLITFNTLACQISLLIIDSKSEVDSYLI